MTNRRFMLYWVAGAILLLLPACAALQSFLHVISGGMIGPPTANSNAAGQAAYSAFLTWLGALLGFTDPVQQMTATTLTYGALLGNSGKVAKGTVATVKGGHRVVKHTVKAVAKLARAPSDPLIPPTPPPPPSV